MIIDKQDSPVLELADRQRRSSVVMRRATRNPAINARPTNSFELGEQPLGSH